MSIVLVPKLPLSYLIIVYFSSVASAFPLNDFKQLIEVSKVNATNPATVFCDRRKIIGFQPCLCYVNFTVNGSDNDVLTVTNNGMKEIVNVSQLKCAMTFIEGGRLGNVMTQYAVLYSLARMNNRSAFMTPGMAAILQPYFKVTIPALSTQLMTKINWTSIAITDWMQEKYRHMEGQFLKVRNYVPSSFSYYDFLKDEIKREFTLRDDHQNKAQNILRNIKGNRSSVTFVGVHVRRGDFEAWMRTSRQGVVGDKVFYEKATQYFRSRYSDAVFVVVSNGMEWCKENIPSRNGDVVFVGNNNETDPIRDFSILINCNHTIFSVGTYGHWAAYLTGGEVVYLANFTLPNAAYRQFFKTGNTFLSHWIPIQADLSILHGKTTKTKRSIESRNDDYRLALQFYNRLFSPQLNHIN
ncbi:fucosyltransferase 1 (galactoside 2-alpha-L-fucosyltransferase, H blood group) [Chamberlinius hualienensis]